MTYISTYVSEKGECMSIYRLSGELILGSRLKRLSDRLLYEVSQIYKEMDLPFEPSWFPVFYLLDKYESLTVSDIAKELEISQPGVSQMVSSLEKKGLLLITFSPDDKRVRTVSFSQKGKDLLKDIKPVWQSLQGSILDLLNEGDYSQHFLKALDELEDNLDNGVVSKAVTSKLNR